MNVQELSNELWTDLFWSVSTYPWAKKMGTVGGITCVAGSELDTEENYREEKIWVVVRDGNGKLWRRHGDWSSYDGVVWMGPSHIEEVEPYIVPTTAYRRVTQ